VRSEVKGYWFVTMRRYVVQEHGQAIFDRYIAAVPEAIRETVRDAVVSHWYPEETLRDALIPFHAIVTGGSDSIFSTAMERAGGMGVNWFLRVLASAATPAYLLRLLPTTLSRLRRGPVRVAVVMHERAATLRFTGQPYADDPRYKLATPAFVRALLGVCVGPTVRAHLSFCDASTHVCEVSW
jgi:hypothetical protein